MKNVPIQWCRDKKGKAHAYGYKFGMWSPTAECGKVTSGDDFIDKKHSKCKHCERIIEEG